MSEAAQRKGKPKVENRKAEALTTPEERAVFTSSTQQKRSSKNKSQCMEKVGSSDASSNALQDQGKKVQGNLSQTLMCARQNAFSSLKPTN